MNPFLLWLARHPVRLALIALAILLLISGAVYTIGVLQPATTLNLSGERFVVRAGGGRVMSGGMQLVLRPNIDSVVISEGQAFNSLEFPRIHFNMLGRDALHRVSLVWINNLEPQRVYRVQLESNPDTVLSQESLSLATHSGWRGSILGVGLAASHPTGQGLFLQSIQLRPETTRIQRMLSGQPEQSALGHALRISPDGSASKSILTEPGLWFWLIASGLIVLVAWALRGLVSGQTALLFAATGITVLTLLQSILSHWARLGFVFSAPAWLTGLLLLTPIALVASLNHRLLASATRRLLATLLLWLLPVACLTVARGLGLSPSLQATAQTIYLLLLLVLTAFFIWRNQAWQGKQMKDTLALPAAFTLIVVLIALLQTATMSVEQASSAFAAQANVASLAAKGNLADLASVLKTPYQPMLLAQWFSTLPSLAAGKWQAHALLLVWPAMGLAFALALIGVWRERAWSARAMVLCGLLLLCFPPAARLLSQANPLWFTALFGVLVVSIATLEDSDTGWAIWGVAVVMALLQPLALAWLLVLSLLALVRRFPQQGVYTAVIWLTPFLLMLGLQMSELFANTPAWLQADTKQLNQLYTTLRSGLIAPFVLLIVLAFLLARAGVPALRRALLAVWVWWWLLGTVLCLPTAWWWFSAGVHPTALGSAWFTLFILPAVPLAAQALRLAIAQANPYQLSEVVVAAPRVIEREAVPLAPVEDPRALLERGLVLQQGGQIAAAKGLFEEVLTIDPLHPDAQHLLGLIALERGAFAEAQDRIQKAIEVLPDFPTFHQSLADVYAKQNQFAQAQACLERCIALDPNQMVAKSKLLSIKRKATQQRQIASQHNEPGSAPPERDGYALIINKPKP
jgi:tetratricopeptide (TPR) repeat protein